mmetsp:Transcript_18639/g.44859  ORF Transcript_18639/g.44859 Transcript_18639/m.44859 type:complete len:882 (+) Transcript_18639:153-2798(+)
MKLFTPKRKSGLPSPASGVFGSGRKSKLQTPQSKRVSKLANSSTSKESDIVERSCSAPIIERSSSSPSRSLDQSSGFLTEKKKIINEIPDTVHPSPTKKAHPAAVLSPVSNSTVPSTLDNEEAVKVCVRIKPLLEGDNEPRAFVLGSTENTIVKHSDGTESSFSFNRVYGETSSTQQVYDGMVSDIVQSVGRQGRNGTVFTYGQTAAGKTYTMQGILLAAWKDLFAMSDHSTTCDERGPAKSSTSIRISCMELYNEELRDLIDTTSTASLSIQEDRRGIMITNLSERLVSNLDELMNVIRIAGENRTIGSTAINEQSSRSHAIYQITYEKKEVANAVGSYAVSRGESEDKENGDMRSSRSGQRSNQKVITTVSTLSLVDLAGSESVRLTGVKGDRQKEGGKINQSLLTLSRVLVKLGQNDPGHINYRDSKLTRILKPSLSGNARMGCICCISPATQYSEESKSTLDFASRTMLVTTNAKSNQKVEYDDALVREFDMEIERIKMETAKAEEGRRKMKQSLKEAEDQIICLGATIAIEKRKVASLEKQRNDSILQAEKLETDHDKTIKNLLSEITELKARSEELETSMAQSEDKKEGLTVTFDHELKLLEERHASDMAGLKAQNHELESRIIQYQTENRQCHQERKISEEGLADDVAELKARNQELEANIALCETKRNRLREQQEKDRDLFDQERMRLEEGRAFMDKMHKMELEQMQSEARKHKESKEEIEVLYKEMQTELESNSKELQTLRDSIKENDGKLLIRIGELERMNSDLTNQLANPQLGQAGAITPPKSNAKTHSTKGNEGDKSSQDEVITTLKSQVEALAEEKLHLEWKLAREAKKSKQRKDQAKERRQKFKGRLSDMTGSLKEDLVQLSYEKIF